MDLLEAFTLLDHLYEDVNSTEVATWVALPEYLKDILTNNTLLTSENTSRPKTSGLYDPRGNHICFSTDHLNPANVLQKFNFGLLFDRAGLERYCSENSDSLGLKHVEADETNWLARHFDFEKNLAIHDDDLSKSNNGGIYVVGLAEAVSGIKIIKLLNWERPVQIHENNQLELELWNVLVDVFKTNAAKYDFWVVDGDSSDEDKEQLGTNYRRLYGVKPLSVFKGVKQISKYKYYSDSAIYPASCIRLYSETGDSDIQVFAPNSHNALDTISNRDVKNHLIDDMVQEEEFRLYFKKGVQEFKFDPKLVKKIYMPSVYFITDKERNNIPNNFLDVELLYAMFRSNNAFTAHPPSPNDIFTYVYNNLERFDGSAVLYKTRKATAKAHFDYNYRYLKTQSSVSLTDLYWAIRLAAFSFPVIRKLSEKNLAGVVKTINAITALRNIFLEIFKIAKDKYPNATIKFYKRTIVAGEVAPQVELDTDANDRLDSISGKDPSRVLAGIKNRSFYTSRIKNRHMNLDSKDDE